MPKPIFGDNGSGMHVHQSLWNDGEPLFYDETGYAGLSDMARYYIGGILKHAPSLLAFTNPTVNSYHRLVPGFEAPSTWSTPAQPLGLRAHPDHGANPKAKRIEFRCPDPSANPYLAFSRCCWPASTASRTRSSRRAVDKDIYELPPDEMAEIAQVPTSLNAVLDALEADHDFLLEGGVFTPDLIETWIDYKRTNEILPVPAAPAPARVRALLRHLRREGCFYGPARPRRCTVRVSDSS
jgi:glutamine synthetase